MLPAVSASFSSSAAVPAPVHLEWRHISVAIKQRGDNKPPPIDLLKLQRKEERAVEQQHQQHILVQHHGACSTVSPPLVASASSLPTFSPAPRSTPSSNTEEQHLTAVVFASSPPPRAAFRTIIHPPEQLYLPSLYDLPLAPEFSLHRPDLPAPMVKRMEASEPTGRGDEKWGEEEDDTPQQPVMVFHSQPESLNDRKSDLPGLQHPLQPQPQPQLLTRAMKLILNDISGYALPGQLLAIMGSSGAGKTTLLNVLSGRHASSSSRISDGRIMINGREIPYPSLSKHSKVVQQNDLLVPVMTVRELLRFAAVMKLPESVTEQEREERVTKVIQELGLAKCQHFIVGSSGAGDADSGASTGVSGSSDSNAGGDNESAQVSSSGTGTGVSRSGISGGEQRRLSIGLELISDPQLLFLDGQTSRQSRSLGDAGTHLVLSLISYLSSEPTSGLDSSTAYTIISLLKRLATNRGRTIILTIHSPSSKLFKLFDRLLLLAPGASGTGARVAYQGSASGVLEYFSHTLDLGVESIAARMGRRAENMTSSDYLMALLERKTEKGIRAEWNTRKEEGADMEQIEENDDAEDAAVERCLREDEERLAKITLAYLASPDVFPEHLLPSSKTESISSGSFHPGSSATISWPAQVKHLTHRTYLTHTRSISYLKAKLFTVLFLGFYVGLLYLQPDPSYSPQSKNFNQTSIFNRVGYIFFVTCMEAMIRLFNAVLTCQYSGNSVFAREQSSFTFLFLCLGFVITSVTEERSLFLRECSNRMYSISAYFLSKQLIEIPLHTVLSFVFGAIGYLMVGMNQETSHVLKFLILLSLHGHAVASIGLFLGCLIHVPIIAVMLCPLTVIPLMLTSGFFINNTTMPVYLNWLSYFSPHRFFFTGAMGEEFRSLTLHCDKSEISTILLAPESFAPQPFQYCSMVKGETVLQLLSLPFDSYANDAAALVAISLAFRLVAYIALAASVKENRLKIKAARRRVLKHAETVIAAVTKRVQTRKHS